MRCVAACQVGRVCSALVRFVRLWSGCSGLVMGCALSGRGGVRRGWGWSDLFRFGRDVRGWSWVALYLVGVVSAWLGLVGLVRVWSALFGFVQVWSGCSGLVMGCALSGRGGSAWSGFGRRCSDLFRFGRGVRGWLWVVLYLVGGVRRGWGWSGLFGFVQVWSGCSGLVMGCALSGRSGFGVVGVGRTCSGLFRFGRGVSLR